MNFLKRDFLVREPLLVSMLVVITIAFSALTHAYTRSYDRRRTALGREWFDRGQLDLANNNSTAAVEAFRTALFYDPHNWDVSLRLADALSQSGQTEQAFNYYQALRQSRPNNGPVNLQLARLSARKGDSSGAERYYNGALFGDWPDKSEENRRAATLELVQFYLDRGDTGHAESQLIILADNLPEDAQLHTQVANLFARVGDDSRAMDQYRRAERIDPNHSAAILGIGEAAFRLGDFHTAQTYLIRAVRVNESDSSANNLLATLQFIFQLDTSEQSLSEPEKIKRALRTFEIAGNRLQSCADSSVASSVEPQLDRWRQLKAVANPRFLTQHPEEMETLVQFSTSSENLTQSECGPLSPEDSAILAIGHKRDATNK
jgi:Tfp pilus assembly protein PilF